VTAPAQRQQQVDRPAPDGVAVVIGGGGAIGLACAERLRDHRVLLADSSAERLADAATHLQAGGAEVLTQILDIADPGSVRQLATAAADLGPLRVLINCAGLSSAQADGETILRVNLVGTLLVLDAFEPLVGEGTVGVMIASVGGHRGFARHYDPILATAQAATVMQRLQRAGALALARGAYPISKRGVILAVEARAGRWGRRAGRLVSISPGPIGDSAMGAMAMAGTSAGYKGASALGRLGHAREIATAVAFMCSADASYISGVDLLIDGGARAGIDWGAPEEERLRWHGPPGTGEIQQI
jgi:NAD(P)-dependent dehydrogenase (short-subunit alcohol dehydrogenase family)